MPRSVGHTLLSKAPLGRHFAQLHGDVAALTESVTTFIDTGLRRQEGVVVIAMPDHMARFRATLLQRDLDPRPYEDAGQLVLYDAHKVLAWFMRGDAPDWRAFRPAIGGLLERIYPLGPNGARVYGEVVNVLWRRGRVDAAIQIEEFWNTLAREYPFCAFCGYHLDFLDEACYQHPVHEIGRTHTDVLPADDHGTLVQALDDAAREIVGTRVSRTLSICEGQGTPGEARLPLGYRTVLWLKRNAPDQWTHVLRRAREQYHSQQ